MDKMMPDITSGKSADEGRIKWVGMEKIQSAVLIRASLAPAFVNVGVSLVDPQAKGIHMSRLYRICNEMDAQELDAKLLRKLCEKGLESHKNLSDSISLELDFRYLTKRNSLKSDNEAFRSYPVFIKVELDVQGNFKTKLGVDVFYSSACPCSETLARQAVAEKFEKRFASAELDVESIKFWLEHEKGIYAVPHSQRSVARVEVVFSEDFDLDDLEDLLQLVEGTLKTGVQAVVKREDEQAFAVINGEHLMFCEDAARKLSKALDSKDLYADFSVKMIHEESLHPHDAVSYTEKGF